jgi:hypothetical protein
MLTQEWLQNEWHHIIRRWWGRTYEVLYIQREELDQCTTIPQQYIATVLIEDSTQRYTSWFRAGFLQNSQTVAPTAAKVSRPPASSPDIWYQRSHMVSEAYGINAANHTGHNLGVTNSGQDKEGESKRGE